MNLTYYIAYVLYSSICNIELNYNNLYIIKYISFIIIKYYIIYNIYSLYSHSTSSAPLENPYIERSL